MVLYLRSKNREMDREEASANQVEGEKSQVDGRRQLAFRVRYML
jgi:hypothetical protein